MTDRFEFALDRFVTGDSPKFLSALNERYPDPTVPMTGAEIGVWKGYLSARFLDRFPNLKLFMVDAWQPLGPIGRHFLEDHDETVHTAEVYNELMQFALRVTEPFSDRRVIMRMTSENAAKSFRPAWLDWIFIDARHAYSAVKTDQTIWWPAVKSGGIFGGHDYITDTNSPEMFPGVKRAVDEWGETHGLELHLNGSCWWFVKP